MSDVKKLADKLKSAPTATSLSGLSMLCVDSLGALQKSLNVSPIPQTPDCLDANQASPGWMRTRSATANLPENGIGGFLLTLQYDTVARSQIFFCWYPISVFIRMHTSNGGSGQWLDWMKLAFAS